MLLKEFDFASTIKIDMEFQVAKFFFGTISFRCNYERPDKNCGKD